MRFTRVPSFHHEYVTIAPGQSHATISVDGILVHLVTPPVQTEAKDIRLDVRSPNEARDDAPLVVGQIAPQAGGQALPGSDGQRVGDEFLQTPKRPSRMCAKPDKPLATPNPQI